MGDAIVGDVALALKRLVELVGESERRRAPARAPSPRSRPPPNRSAAREAMAALADAWPDDGIAVVETPSSTRWRCATGSGSRGPAATTSAPAAGSASGSRRRSACSSPSPQRPVVCVLGEGSAQYGITALWSAVAYKVAGHLPRAAQRGVHDPQVVLDARAGHRARPGSSCRVSTSPRSPGATA